MLKRLTGIAGKNKQEKDRQKAEKEDWNSRKEVLKDQSGGSPQKN